MAITHDYVDYLDGRFDNACSTAGSQGLQAAQTIAEEMKLRA